MSMQFVCPGSDSASQGDIDMDIDIDIDHSSSTSNRLYMDFLRVRSEEHWCFSSHPKN